MVERIKEEEEHSADDTNGKNLLINNFPMNFLLPTSTISQNERHFISENFESKFRQLSYNSVFDSWKRTYIFFLAQLTQSIKISNTLAIWEDICWFSVWKNISSVLTVGQICVMYQHNQTEHKCECVCENKCRRDWKISTNMKKYEQSERNAEQ